MSNEKDKDLKKVDMAYFNETVARSPVMTPELKKQGVEMNHQAKMKWEKGEGLPQRTKDEMQEVIENDNISILEEMAARTSVLTEEVVERGEEISHQMLKEWAREKGQRVWTDEELLALLSEEGKTDIDEMASRTMMMTEEVIEAGEETFYNYLDEWAKKEGLI